MSLHSQFKELSNEHLSGKMKLISLTSNLLNLLGRYLKNA
jgi:hypothetical protein